VAWHPTLERTQPPAYDSELYLVGRIQGALEALATLSSYVNHAPTLGLIEAATGDDLAALTDLPEGSRVALRPMGPDWAASLRAEIEQVLVSDNELACAPPATRAAWVEAVRGLVAAIAELVVRLGLAPHWLTSEPRNPFGYLRDASVALVSSTRTFVLAIGWSD
jgi:hypothetical protein